MVRCCQSTIYVLQKDRVLQTYLVRQFRASESSLKTVSYLLVCLVCRAVKVDKVDCAAEKKNIFTGLFEDVM